MIRITLFIIFFLCFALALQIAIEPQFLMLAPPRLSPFFMLIPLSLAGILVGFLRGELLGIGVATIAAMLFGFSRDPGGLGAAIVSFVTVAYLAGMLARRLRLQGYISCCFFCTVLLLTERLIWYLVRCFFFQTQRLIDIPKDISLWAILLTAVLGTFVFRLVASRIKVNLIQSDQI